MSAPTPTPHLPGYYPPTPAESVTSGHRDDPLAAAGAALPPIAQEPSSGSTTPKSPEEETSGATTASLAALALANVNHAHPAPEHPEEVHVAQPMEEPSHDILVSNARLSPNDDNLDASTPMMMARSTHISPMPTTALPDSPIRQPHEALAPPAIDDGPITPLANDNALMLDLSTPQARENNNEWHAPSSTQEPVPIPPQDAINEPLPETNHAALNPEPEASQATDPSAVSPRSQERAVPIASPVLAATEPSKPLPLTSDHLQLHGLNDTQVKELAYIPSSPTSVTSAESKSKPRRSKSVLANGVEESADHSGKIVKSKEEREKARELRKEKDRLKAERAEAERIEREKEAAVKRDRMMNTYAGIPSPETPPIPPPVQQKPDTTPPRLAGESSVPSSPKSPTPGHKKRLSLSRLFHRKKNSVDQASPKK